MPRRLQDHDLKQINDAYVIKLNFGALQHLSVKLLHDLKEAREQLNQNSGNSSKPPSSRAPWEELPEKNGGDGTPSDTNIIPASPSDEDENIKPDASEDAIEPEADGENKPNTPPVASTPPVVKRKQGKQPGAQGYGRTWNPPIDFVVHHQASHCAACGSSLGEEATHTAYTAYDSVDIQWGTPERPGIVVNTTRNTLYESICPCGHSTHYTPHEAVVSPLYPNVKVSEWRLIGPNLAAVIVNLRLRHHLSVRGTQELLREMVGIPLSTGALQECYEEVAASAAPLEEVLVNELLDEAAQPDAVLNADETGWKERGKTLWLWTFVTKTTAYFKMGRRTIDVLDSVIGMAFASWLMSDGYAAYRHHPNRLRCWAHLIRKAVGLMQSLDKDGRTFGGHALTLLDALKAAVYGWREAGGEAGQKTDAIRKKYQEALVEFRQHCLAYAASPHEKTAALAKEFINDWDAVFRVIDHPWLPLTNNDAERALRHWVILRKTNHGTKCPKGSRAFALLASISATCRLRGQSGLSFFASVITAARTGQPLPALPKKAGV